MPKPKTVVDLLSELPEDQLRAMRDAIREELARAQTEVSRLQVEAQQVEQAMGKRQRDGSRASGRLTAQQVLDVVVAQAGKEVSVADVVRLLAAEGISATPNAVRNHLLRLAQRDELIRVGDRYAAPAKSQPQSAPATTSADFPTAIPDDDIPF